MEKIIPRKFYEVPTKEAARNLLGMTIARRTEKGILRGKIVETEAYTQEEESCHAYKGRTKRNEAMFKQAGTLYVYFTYGMHYCMNIITEREGFAAAVLIRAIEPLGDFDNTNGPAKLCKALKVTKELNEVDLCTKKSPIWLEYSSPIEDKDVVQTSRIGIKLAAELPWRFYIKGNKYVSKP